MSGLGSQQQRYSSGAIWLHWLIAFALAGEIALGLTMPKDASGFALFQLHKSIGITILLLSVVRLGWRLTHKRPSKIEGGVTGFLASAVHVLFYAFMILMPLTGWAVVSSTELDIPTLLFGAIPWPHLPIEQALNHFFEESHEIIGKVGIGLFLLHVVGALRHHFLKGDALIGRMAPRGMPWLGLFLGAGVIATSLAVLIGVGGPNAEGEAQEAASEPLPTMIGAEAVPETTDEEGEAEDGADTDAEELAEEELPEAEETAAAETDEAASAPAGPPPEWTIQPGGSLRFAVGSGDMQYTGSFGDWGGSIVMDPENPASANIAIDVRLGSASMGDATQDQMLKGADFLSVSAFPTATYRSTSVTSLGGGRFRANGTLSIKGASRPQAITFTLAGSGDRRSVTGQASIERNAFAVGTGDSAADLAGSVTVNFAFDATS